LCKYWAGCFGGAETKKAPEVRGFSLEGGGDGGN